MDELYILNNIYTFLKFIKIYIGTKPKLFQIKKKFYNHSFYKFDSVNKYNHIIHNIHNLNDLQLYDNILFNFFNKNKYSTQKHYKYININKSKLHTLYTDLINYYNIFNHKKFNSDELIHICQEINSIIYLIVKIINNTQEPNIELDDIANKCYNCLDQITSHNIDYIPCEYEYENLLNLNPINLNINFNSHFINNDLLIKSVKFNNYVTQYTYNNTLKCFYNFFSNNKFSKFDVSYKKFIKEYGFYIKFNNITNQYYMHFTIKKHI